MGSNGGFSAAVCRQNRLKTSALKLPADNNCIVTENTLSLVSDIAVLKIASLRYFYIRVSWAGNLSTDVLKRFSVTIQSCQTAIFSAATSESSESGFSVHTPCMSPSLEPVP